LNSVEVLQMRTGVDVAILCTQFIATTLLPVQCNAMHFDTPILARGAAFIRG
jgi:hypothetical protein